MTAWTFGPAQERTRGGDSAQSPTVVRIEGPDHDPVGESAMVLRDGRDDD